MKKPSTPQSGMTLVEVMVVLAIIGILLSIASVAWLRSRAEARAKVCQENQAKLMDAIHNWALEKGMKLEDSPTWDILVGPAAYLRRTPVCPIGNTPIAIPSVGGKTVCPTGTDGHEISTQPSD